ncbi:MAG: SdiA-regulated domain-containing protein [Woeseia sp.]
MIISIRRLVLTCCLLPLACAADDDSLLALHVLDADHMEQWRLPERLQEVSGLALTSDERLLAVADEKAVVFEIDVDKRRLVKAFALGDPVLRGDFEGIAIVDDEVILITSDGDLYRSREGDDGEQVEYTLTETGLGKRCEIEGLAAHAARQELLIACKQPRNGMQRVPIFVWSLPNAALIEERTIDLPLGPISKAIRERRLNPSGIAIDPQTGNLLLVAARQRAIVELTSEGRLLSVVSLPLAHRHRQPEGIEIMRDGRLLIADEGGNHKARLAVYAARSKRVVVEQ